MRKQISAILAILLTSACIFNPIVANATTNNSINDTNKNVAIEKTPLSELKIKDYQNKNKDSIDFTVEINNLDKQYDTYELFISEENSKNYFIHEVGQFENKEINVIGLNPNTKYKINFILNSKEIREEYVGTIVTTETEYYIDNMSLCDFIPATTFKNTAYIDFKSNEEKNNYMEENYQYLDKDAMLLASDWEVESNNTFALADTIGDYPMFGYINPQSDIDHYKKTFTTSGKATILLTSVPSNADYDLYVYDSNYNQIGSGRNGSGQSESVTVDVVANKVYYFKVVSYSGFSATQNYAIATEITGGGDSYEPNNSFSASSDLGIVSTNKSVYATINSKYDMDYFKFRLNGAAQVSFYLNNIPSGCDYDLEIYDQNNNLIKSSSNSGTTSENIQLYLNPDKYYYIKVKSYSGMSDLNYNLMINIDQSFKTLPGKSVNINYATTTPTGEMVVYTDYYLDKASAKLLRDGLVKYFNNNLTFSLGSLATIIGFKYSVAGLPGLAYAMAAWYANDMANKLSPVIETMAEGTTTERLYVRIQSFTSTSETSSTWTTVIMSDVKKVQSTNGLVFDESIPVYNFSIKY